MNIATHRQLATTLAVLGMLVTGNTGATVSQVPLTGSGVSVPPNLMFTLDNSGSMHYECLPDKFCVVSYHSIGSIPGGMGPTKSEVATYDAGKLFARQMRSVMNPLYYNPAVRYRPWLKHDGTRFPEYRASAAPVDPIAPTAETFDLSREQTLSTYWCTEATVAGCTRTKEEDFWQTFRPAQYYRLRSGRAGAAVGDFEQVIITDKEELQNFSNWYTYARSRVKAAIGATAEAFADVPAAYRVGFGTINGPKTDVDGVETFTVRRGVRPFSGIDKKTFYDLLHSAQVTGPTPLRRAMDDVGQYFSRRDSRSPWAADPLAGETPSAHLACRRTFHVLMTDGIWNGAAATTSQASGNVDGTPGPVITHANKSDTWSYQPAAPFKDDTAGTLADVAMYYWRTDLRPDLENSLKPTEANPAFWQHMVNYTLAFGVNGTLRNPGDKEALKTGTRSWGVPVSDGGAANIDDLWHAAMNSRGESKSAANAAEYRQALRSIIQEIETRSGNEAGVALSSRDYAGDARKYVPSYNTSDWSGDIQAVTLGSGDLVWKASMPAPDDRNIYTYKDATGTVRGVPFKYDKLRNAGLLKDLDTTDDEGLVNYLRGDRTGEASGVYRKRSTLIGDIVNATPVLVKDLVDGQYDFLPSGTPGQTQYRPFLEGKKHRTPQLFVGANDGMLHAFNDGNGNKKGVETFAFVPRGVLGELKRLAMPSYSHRYFVDGPLAEVDVFDLTATKWRNVVLGSGGAGAKNLFAINVPVRAASAGNSTVLDDAASAPGASDILWEIRSDDGDYAELGHVLRAPEAGLLKDGKWAVVTGNGYDSASNKAQLFVVDAITGALLALLDTGAGSSDAPNGLGGVKLLRDLNQRVVAAYAGDLQGNMWKFDLSSARRSDWKVAFGGKPLFRALDSQDQPEPITAAPAYAAHPLGGVVVLAGSGKLFEQDDPTNTQQRSLYGVWDRVRVGSSSGNPDAALSQNSALVDQSMTLMAGGKFFAISNNGVDYGGTANKRGWRLRLTGSAGQRLIYDVRTLRGRAFFDAMTPGGNAGQTCSATSPQGARFILDPFTGAPGRDGPTFDTNADGLIDSADDSAAGASIDAEAGRRAIAVKPGGAVRLEGVGAPVEAQLGKDTVKRQWRQIVTPPPY
ncbi:MAG: PilC/PilY family type IV pilus protein [Variovorax sp.]